MNSNDMTTTKAPPTEARSSIPVLANKDAMKQSSARVRYCGLNRDGRTWDEFPVELPSAKT